MDMKSLGPNPCDGGTFAVNRFGYACEANPRRFCGILLALDAHRPLRIVKAPRNSVLDLINCLCLIQVPLWEKM